ncbi:MAG: type II CRISPR RNA-guided endonuclease Cas9 [Oscillospiraceae bacterium]|nr:type II CRISPR RNA-guided endonuclease Cas9 [Oscillospiraceae bacterium]
MSNNYYLGLDIGTDSVGYAVTNEQYDLMKFHGESAWGVTLFDEASLSAERRSFRTARRRLERRKQRVSLLQELFAEEICKIDPRFFVRLRESALFREDAEDEYSTFNDPDYTDVEFHRQYPTIHHLICDLMDTDEPRDVRLVYLAAAWLVAHRGHFLSSIDKNALSNIKDFTATYREFSAFFSDNGYTYPWSGADPEKIAAVLRMRIGTTSKEKQLIAVLLGEKKPSKIGTEEFPFSEAAAIKLIAGGTCKLSDLYCREEYTELGSVSLKMDDDKLAEISAKIGDDFDIIAAMRKVFDWSVLVDSLGDSSTISEAKVRDYEQHGQDLKALKRIIRKYCSKEKYDEVFRSLDGKDNYAAYAYHTDGDRRRLKKKKYEDFKKYILGILKNITAEEEDASVIQEMTARLDAGTFMPKQKTTDNRVIPYQLYWYELKAILEKAEGYLPFLKDKDGDGISVSEKIMSVFSFRIPYFVGPLNSASERAWVVRKPGKIYPWTFDKMVDLDASEEAFIKNLIGRCTYLPNEYVLPKDSLLYHKFSVLNEINNLRINGERISVELKQKIYGELFLNKKKVTRKKLLDYLKSEGAIDKDGESLVSGIDEEIKSNLTPQIDFRRLITSGTLSEADVERIIERASCAEDKTRLLKWLEDNYPDLDDSDRKYICAQRYKDFGRLSRRLLSEITGADKKTGEAYTIIGALWNTQYNLMELLSDKFTFAEEIEKIRAEHYAAKPLSLADRMDEMYLSNSVKRSVFRTLDIVKDVKKAFGEPSKIFIEMTRGTVEDQKGKRTKSRRQQILDLYAACRDEDVRLLKKQLEDMGESADMRLQGDKLFLYYMQLGKSMYSGKTIELDKLGTKLYDIDHIYPQAFVKDDSILNNKVLVLSEENGQKSNVYPIADSVRKNMRGFWDALHKMEMITDEKYKRLIRATPFTDEEKLAFINRQLTETSQSAKAVATLLKEYMPDTEIVYCKARLTTEFREEFKIWKSRAFNDLHHAADAYLNIVTGNVYNMKFTKNFNVRSEYSLRTKTLFTRPLISSGRTVWEGQKSIDKVKKIAEKNTAHFTKFAFFKTGGFFDQMPVSAAEGLVPRKKGLATEKYGGYNKPGVMFFIPVRYRAGKKTELFILPVELLHGARFLSDGEYARKYAIDRLGRILGKKIDEITFPMGMRPWKVNTMLSLDGFRVCIAGTSSGGRCLIAQPVIQFSAAPFWRYYIKKIERFIEKTLNNPKYIFDEKYDEITAEKNVELYDLYCEKLKNSIYRKRVNAPTEIFLKGREKFLKLNTSEQASALLKMHQVFGRIAGGVDLTAIGGAGKAASTQSFSATVSNWKKNYSDVRLIDASPSGLWEKTSDNLLDLI